MQIDQIGAWEAFLGVAGKGSFSSASKSLKIPVPQVSKRISRLESQLGVRLFHRTTRVVSLTDEGRALLPKIRSILEDLKEAESLFEDRQSLQGKIKITCVPFVAHRLLLPLFAEFLALHPKVQFELELTEKFSDLVESGFDMAIRIETPKDSSLVYRRLLPNDLVFCASPAYLKKRPPLTSISHLRNHDLLMLGIHRRCRFQRSEVSLREFECSRKVICDDGIFLTEMALSGFGVLVRSIWDVKTHLETGALVQVLSKHPLETFGHIHAVVTSKRYLTPRVRAWLDFLVERSKIWNEKMDRK